jgi:hypothetical protein
LDFINFFFFYKILFFFKKLFFFFWGGGGMLLQFSVVVPYFRRWRQPIKFISRHALCDKQCYASLKFLLWNKLHMINGVHCLTTYDKQCYASLIWWPPLPKEKNPHCKKGKKKDPVYFHYQSLFTVFYVPDPNELWFHFALHSSYFTGHFFVRSMNQMSSFWRGSWFFMIRGFVIWWTWKFLLTQVCDSSLC